MTTNDFIATSLLRAARRKVEIVKDIKDLLNGDEFRIEELNRLTYSMNVVQAGIDCFSGFDKFNNKHPEATVEDFTAHKMHTIQRRLVREAGLTPTLDPMTNIANQARLNVMSDIVLDMEDEGFTPRAYENQS